MSDPPDAVRSWLASRVDAGAFPGAAWWVEDRRGVITRGAVGAAGPGLEPATEATPYDLASLTKPLCTALLATVLEGQGRIDLEAPVGRWLVEMSGSVYASASLADLGSHRARLPAWRPLYLEASSLEGYLWRIAQEPPVPAGSPYSDLGYLVLGAAVERAAGKPLDALFATEVAAPLRLRATGFAAAGPFDGAAPTEVGNRHERAMAASAGIGFRWREEVIRGRVHDVNAHVLGGVAGHAGLFGTAPEVAAIAREILRPGALALTPGARRRLLEPAIPGGERTFGLVLARASDAARGVLPDAAPGHVGFTGTSVWLDPAAGGVYVLLTNRVHPRVAEVDFQAERRRFHEVAAEVAASRGAGESPGR